MVLSLTVDVTHFNSFRRCRAICVHDVGYCRLMQGSRSSSSELAYSLSTRSHLLHANGRQLRRCNTNKPGCWHLLRSPRRTGRFGRSWTCSDALLRSWALGGLRICNPSQFAATARAGRQSIRVRGAPRRAAPSETPRACRAESACARHVPNQTQFV